MVSIYFLQPKDMDAARVSTCRERERERDAFSESNGFIGAARQLRPVERTGGVMGHDVHVMGRIHLGECVLAGNCPYFGLMGSQKNLGSPYVGGIHFNTIAQAAEQCSLSRGCKRSWRLFVPWTFAGMLKRKWLWVKINGTILGYFLGDWDVHWGVRAFDPWPKGFLGVVFLRAAGVPACWRSFISRRTTSPISRRLECPKSDAT